MAGEAPGLQFANLVKNGQLRTTVRLNGREVDYLNRHVATKNEAPERVRLPIPAGLLKAGRNVLRFEQAGIASDPNYLDDLGILEIALEFDADRPAAPAPARGPEPVPSPSPILARPRGSAISNKSEISYLKFSIGNLIVLIAVGVTQLGCW